MWSRCLYLPYSSPATGNPLSAFIVAGGRIRKQALFALALLLVVGGLETAFYLDLPVPTIWGYYSRARGRVLDGDGLVGVLE